MSQNIHVYTCPFGHTMVTVEIAEGSTPMLMTCRQNHVDGKQCTAATQINLQKSYAGLIPEFEWYKPVELRGLSRQEKDHVREGGLLLRKIEQSQLPTIADVLEFAKPFLYDRPGTDTDLYSMMRPAFEKIIEFAQARKVKK